MSSWQEILERFKISRKEIFMTAVEGYSDVVIWGNEQVELVVPPSPLKTGALEIATKDPKKLSEWTRDEHIASLECMQKIARVWEKQGIEQHLIFGKVEGEKSFPGR